MTKLESARTKRAAHLANLPERLKRLNREMMLERSKDIDDSIHVVRDGFRFKVTVIRISVGYMASAKVDGYIRQYTGQMPSDAVESLAKSLAPVVRKMEFERQAATALMMEAA